MFNISNPDIEMPDEQLTIAIFRSIRWVHGVYCPQCKSYNINNRGMQGRVRRYSCKDCGSNFNDFTGTFFIKSKIPLGVMLYILLNMETIVLQDAYQSANIAMTNMINSKSAENYGIK